MPKIFETFGFPLSDRSKKAEACRKKALCPFMNFECDGGGNRYLSHIDLTKHQNLKDYFPGKSVVPSGVCSLQLKPDESPWIVCPRRLLVLGKNEVEKTSHQNFVEDFLLSHSRFVRGTKLGVWPELKMKFTEKRNNETKSFDYTFDFILIPQDMVDQDQIENKLGQTWRKVRPILEASGFTLARRNGKDYVEDFPIGSPLIVEIMTCSTSGGNKNKRTTIPQAFEDAILDKPHNGPGINYRQIWARMVSQLVVKSEVALSWEGKAFWILQDNLLNYISKTTALNIHNFLSKHSSEVNMLCFSYGDQYQNPDGIIEINKGSLYSGPISPSNSSSGEQYFQDMIRTPVSPPISMLLNLVIKRKPSNQIIVS